MTQIILFLKVHWTRLSFPKMGSNYLGCTKGCLCISWDDRNKLQDSSVGTNISYFPIIEEKPKGEVEEFSGSHIKDVGIPKLHRSVRYQWPWTFHRAPLLFTKQVQQTWQSVFPKQKKKFFKNSSLIHVIILQTCVISLFFYENTIAKGKQYNVMSKVLI